MYEIPKVKDVFPVQDSIFTNISYDFGITKADLDVMFFSDFGLKSISPIVVSILGDNDELTSEQLSILGRMMLAKYQNRWDRLKAVEQKEYDPIHNYLDEYSESSDYEDSENGSKSSSGHTDDSSTNSNTTTRTDNLSESNAIHSESSGTNSSENGYFGFNSASSTGVDDSSGSEGSESDESSTKLNTGTQTSSDSESLRRRIDNTASESNTVSGSGNKSREGYHRGNIGNISTQKLLKEEIDLWKWNFMDEILHDARDFLTIRVYSL